MVGRKKSDSFDYFKPANGTGALMLSQSGSCTDSHDSDTKSMFSLPKRRIIRPKGSLSRRNGLVSCCRYCCVTVVPVVGAFAFVGLVACLVFLLLGMNGLQRDLELFRLRINQVEADDDSNLQSSTKLQQDLNGKLSALANDEKEINELREKLKIANFKIDQLNQTVLSLRLHMTKAGSVATLSSDVDNLKKGMADTGVEIQKLTDEQDDMKKKNDKLVTIVKTINHKIFNISAKVLLSSAVGPLPPTFPPIPSWRQSPELKNLAHKMITLSKSLQGEQDKWKADLKNNSNYMKMEMYKLYSYLDVINETCQVAHSSDRQSVTSLQNSTKNLQGKLHLVELKLMPLVGVLRKKNSSSNVSEEVIEGRISTLTDVVDQQRVKVDNMTERLTYLEKLAKEALASETSEVSPTTVMMPTTQTGLPVAVITTNAKLESEAIKTTSQATNAIVTETLTTVSVPVTDEESFEALTTSTTIKNATIQTTPLPMVNKEVLPVKNITLPLASQNISSNGTTSLNNKIKPTLSVITSEATISSDAGIPAVKTTAVPITHERIHRTINSPTRGNRFDVLDENNDNNPRDFNWNNEGDDNNDDDDMDNLDDM